MLFTSGLVQYASETSFMRAKCKQLLAFSLGCMDGVHQIFSIFGSAFGISLKPTKMSQKILCSTMPDRGHTKWQNLKIIYLLQHPVRFVNAFAAIDSAAIFTRRRNSCKYCTISRTVFVVSIFIAIFFCRKMFSKRRTSNHFMVASNEYERLGRRIKVIHERVLSKMQTCA